MTLDELTQAMHDFVGSKGWYSPDTLKPQTPKNIASSLVIEAAEVLEHFQWSNEARDLTELSSELADVALYLLQLASVTGINLERAILDKLAVNAGRTWSTPGAGESTFPGGDPNAAQPPPSTQIEDLSSGE